MNFFDLYGQKFNYSETCIRVTDGGKYFARDEIPDDEFSGTRSDICIERPVIEDIKFFNPPHSSLRIKPIFECAYHSLSTAMSNCTENCILGSIVNIPENIIEYRKWIHNKFAYVTLIAFNFLSYILQLYF